MTENEKLKEGRKKESKIKEANLAESAGTPPAVTRSPWFHLSNDFSVGRSAILKQWVKSRIFQDDSPSFYSSFDFWFLFSLLLSLYWASAALFSHQDAAVGQAFSALEVEQRILAPRMTLLTTNTAPLRTMTVGETLCLYHTDMESVATATSARRAVPPGSSPFCPWMGRCTVRWIATEWSPWSAAPRPSRLPLDSSCQRWGHWKPQLHWEGCRLECFWYPL